MHKIDQDWLIDELVNNLAKPIMVLRFARADRRTNSGAAKRAENARRQIVGIVKDFSKNHLSELTHYGES